MKKAFNYLLVSALALSSLFSCKKEAKEVTDEISPEVLARIGQLGFSKKNVQKIDEGYLVEGDIILPESQLNERPGTPRLRIAGEEQYNTFNLVSVSGGTRTITVSVEGKVPKAFSDAVDLAIGRYNAENLSLRFQRTSSAGNIVIRLVNTYFYIAAAGFPTANGNPYNQINYSKQYTRYSSNFMTTVIAHEIGHCIGFRHTDYMNRSYSCGSGGNEGEETTGAGAVLIPGTPVGPDPNSWMLACLSSTTNRPFNANDKVALNYLY